MVFREDDVKGCQMLQGCRVLVSILSFCHHKSLKLVESSLKLKYKMWRWSEICRQYLLLEQFGDLLMSNVFCPEVTQDNGVWSKFRISSFGKLCSRTKLKIFFFFLLFKKFIRGLHLPCRSRLLSFILPNLQWVPAGLHFPSTLLHCYP